jgi:LysR family transcriptional regulator, glycine cleavage system transcriptional activator
MNLRELPALNALKTFEAAARYESFSRAADELFVTHGAVSHQIRALEEALGTPLFSREGKRVRLTDAGCRYAKDVRTALMALADATRSVREGQRARRLVISSSSSFSARWITPRIGRFIERHPEIDVELLSTNVLTDFSRDDVDVGIRFGPGGYPDLYVERLLDEVAFPVCAPTFNGGVLPKTPAELAQSPRLLRSDDQMWSVWFKAAGLDGVPEPRRGLFFQDSSNLVQAAIDGQGVALIRRSIIGSNELATGRLVRLFDIAAPSSSAHWFVCPPPLLQTARVQALRAWLIEEVERFRAPVMPATPVTTPPTPSDAP